jgi:hypothetical protein
VTSRLRGSFTSIPGPVIRADYTVTAAIAGRPVIGSTSGTASTVVNLVEPNSLSSDYQNRLDMRLGKTFRFGQTKIQGFMDVFNVLNAGTATQSLSLVSASSAACPSIPACGPLDAAWARSLKM